MRAYRFGSRTGLAIVAVVSVGSVLVASSARAATVVNCIGEQTTTTAEGSTAAQNWPPVLGGLLGAAYTVHNDGVNAGKVTDGSAVSATSLTGMPGIVIIGPFAEHDYAAGITEATWQADYKKVVDMYLALTPKPMVYVMTPPPAAFVYQSAAEQTFATDVVKPAVLAVAASENLKVIDLFSDATLVTAADVAGDGHFSAAGMAEVAQLAYKCVAMGMCAGTPATGTGGTGGGAGGNGGAGGAGGSTGAAGAGGSTTGTAGATGTTGTGGTGGSTATGTAGSTGTTGAGGTVGTTGTGGDTGTTGTAGTTSTTGTAGMTSTGGTTGTTGTAGSSGGTRSSGGGGCAIGGHSKAGALASLLVALSLAAPAWRRRRRAR